MPTKIFPEAICTNCRELDEDCDCVLCPAGCGIWNCPEHDEGPTPIEEV